MFQVTYPHDPFCGGQGGPLLRQPVYQNIKAYDKMDAALRWRGRLYTAVSELSPSDTILLNPVPWQSPTLHPSRSLLTWLLPAASCHAAWQAWPSHILYGPVYPCMHAGMLLRNSTRCPQKSPACSSCAGAVTAVVSLSAAIYS